MIDLKLVQCTTGVPESVSSSPKSRIPDIGSCFSKKALWSFRPGVQFFSCNTQLLFSVILNFQIFSARQQSVELKSAANTKWKVLKKVMLSVSITSNTEVGQESNLVFDY